MAESPNRELGCNTKSLNAKNMLPSCQDVDIRRESFVSPVAQNLIIQANAYNELLYGHADQSPIDSTEFEPSRRGVFLVAYIEGRPAACGGLRQAEPPAPEGSGEVKRMFVVEEFRRQGLGRLVLAALEEEAKGFGYPQVVLDVGRKQAGAHAMYEACGYHRIPGFTMYRHIPGNRAYAKSLT